MTMTKFLTIVLAIMPTYLALFCSPVWAAIIMSVATLIAVVLTGSFEDDKDMMEKLRLIWAIHLIGVLAVVTFHNI